MFKFIRKSISTKIFLFVLFCFFVIFIYTALTALSLLKNFNQDTIRLIRGFYIDFILEKIYEFEESNFYYNQNDATNFFTSANIKIISWTNSKINFKNTKFPRLNVINNEINQYDFYLVKIIEIKRKKYLYFSTFSANYLIKLSLFKFSTKYEFVLYLIPILLIFIFILVFIYWQIYPIQKLNNATKLIANGNFSKIKQFKFRIDELAKLVNSFNFMSTQIENQLKNKNQLLADISHELRTPLSRINIANEMLENNEKLKKSITEDIHEMNNLIGEILDSFKLNTQTINLNKQKIDATEYFRKIISKYPNQNFKLQIKPKTLLYIDNHHFSKVIFNIINNSIKYSQSNKQIEIEIISRKKESLISIKDFGVGLKENKLNMIFEPLYKISESRTPDSSYGLGLAIAKKNVDLHKGKIKARLTNKNDINHPGLTIEIIIPNE